MTFKTKTQVTESEWKTAVDQRRVVGGRVYSTAKQAADAKKVSNKPPSKAAKNRSPATKKASPSPYKNWEHEDINLDLSSGFAAITLPAGTRYKIASVRATVTTGDVTKLNWRYAFSTSANKAPTLAELVDLSARGDHDISYFKKDFMLQLPAEAKIEDPVHPIFLTFAKKSVCDPDDEDATFAFSMRLLKPPASSSALIHI